MSSSTTCPKGYPSRMRSPYRARNLLAFIAGIMLLKVPLERKLLSSTKKNGRALSLRPGVKVGIATLTTNRQSDVDELCLALKSLLFPRSNKKRFYKTAPVMVFNEGNLSSDQMNKLRTCTDRPISFPFVQLTKSFPKGFDSEEEWEIFEGKYDFRSLFPRHKWSYSLMVRFWTTQLWKHPAVQNYDLVMRIDSDSCFVEQKGPNYNPDYNYLPGLGDKFVYQSNYDGGVGSPIGKKYIQGIYDFAIEFMRKEKITPANPELWEVIRSTWEEEGNLPVFQTNLEIARMSFMRRKDVMKWHDALTEEEPFGVFRRRWGDAQTRVFTIAMFARKNQIKLSRSTGYLHGRGRCGKNFINEIHSMLLRKE